MIFLSRPALSEEMIATNTGSSQQLTGKLDMGGGHSTIRSYSREMDGVFWLEPSLDVVNGDEQSAWWEDSNGKRLMQISLEKVQDVTIILWEEKPQSRHEIPTPPLKIEFARSHFLSFFCQASTLPVKGRLRDYIPPYTLPCHTMPFLVRLNPPYYGAPHGDGYPRPLGAIYFESTTPGKGGFFVVWGFTTRKRPDEHSMSIQTTATSWWDEVEVECCVRTWRDILFPNDPISEALFDGEEASSE